MKSKVEQYAKGDFYVEYPKLTFSKSYLQLKIEAGSIYTGSIQVESVNDIPMKMMVYDDAYLLCLENHSLVGRRSEIRFQFDACGKKRGSVYEGKLHIIGNGMEREIPYNIEVVAPFIDVNGVALEDLMKFCALAERDWNKALSIFQSDEFERTMLAGQSDYVTVYRALKDSVDLNQALEEFLVYIHKKRALTLQVEHSRFQFQFPKMREEHQLILHKNTWGYCNMKVRTDAKFITVHRESVNSLEFDGDKGIVEYTLDPECMDENEVQIGHVILESTYQTISVEVIVKKPEDASRILVHKDHDRRLKKLEKVALIHNYLDYRIGLVSLEQFIEKTRTCLQALISYEPEVGLYKLGLLHMNILAGKKDIAREEIRRMEEDFDRAKEGKREHCYYMYLKAVFSGDTRQVVSACEEIEQALEKEKDKLFYFWLLIYLDDRYQKNKQWMFSQIEGLVMGGYNSPLLAIEICDLINADPLMLRKLTEVEIAAIRFGLKNNYLAAEVKEEFVQLAMRERDFSIQIFSLLKTIYEMNKKPEVIKVICGLLLKGDKTDLSYYPYYLEGIKCGYKLVGIQEHYLRSMDKTKYGLIPESVLRYFNYKSALSDEEYAYLYANVVVNRRQYLSQYEEYLPNMEAFMEDQIVKGAMSDDLCVLYTEFLCPQTVRPNFAGSLTKVIFKRKLTVANDNITSVVISHRELAQAKTYPVINHVAYVDMITESAVVALVDRNQNCYVSTIPYKLQKLVDEDQYMELLGQYAADDYRFVLYQYDILGAYGASKARDVNIARDLLSFEEISDEIKQQAIYSIVRYYHDHLDKDILRSYLNRVDMEYVNPKEGATFINYLLECDYFEKAFDALRRFGYQGVEVNYLVHLVERLRELPQYASEDMLIAIAVYLYRTRQETPMILAYLVDHYQSSVKDMLKLWKRANGKISRLDNLEENILCQTLYTEQWYPEIFRLFAEYTEKKRRGIVIKAFFKRASFAYVVEDVELADAFFDALYRQMMAESLSDDTLYAAQLLYYSRKPRLDKEEVTWVKAQLEHFVKRGILLPFFRSFKRYIKLPKDLYLMTYVVTKDKAGKQIRFRYGIQCGVEKPECNKHARMMEVLPGYYLKEFVLFHGENLLYEMEPENMEHTKIYESEGMKAKGETEEYENRFEMLNSMLFNQEIGESQILINKIDKYLKLAAIVEENLEIME
ncbi:MAG: DUF5717 family protein [Eubacteriales bacterium]|nr:DUF5717 family protein [Eubacteriales bacterium]